MTVSPLVCFGISTHVCIPLSVVVGWSTTYIPSHHRTNKGCASILDRGDDLQYVVSGYAGTGCAVQGKARQGKGVSWPMLSGGFYTRTFSSLIFLFFSSP
ncbi:hypothetical protein K504DRAFT_29198 [Pleomassaria siparia CBS 279.74]|uniref:Uncharacterized protein n=1 Tax=Pleomassaria siparia CBS 279.74 TaxID=1314801 RepID=A0A6G1KRT4_9PLEO|nr:hypothetical protein K504DRAFT_29198 [Pleomassaria siparia CBS 279.74]